MSIYRPHIDKSTYNRIRRTSFREGFEEATGKGKKMNGFLECLCGSHAFNVFDQMKESRDGEEVTVIRCIGCHNTFALEYFDAPVHPDIEAEAPRKESRRRASKLGRASRLVRHQDNEDKH